jgi:hypothetical protein
LSDPSNRPLAREEALSTMEPDEGAQPDDQPEGASKAEGPRRDAADADDSEDSTEP